jgi:serine/threonine-protein kinase
MKLGGSLRRSRKGVKWTVRSGKSAAGFTGYLQSQFGNRRFLAGVGLLAALGFVGGYLFSTHILFPAPPPPGDVARVPDLSGVDVTEASGTLSELGLVVAPLDSVRHPTVPEGTIIGQSPLPGQLAGVGDTVRVAVSLGPEQRPVPDVMRLRGDRAQTVLEASGFQVLVDSVESEIPRGRVLTMEPEAGTETTVPREILLTVSMGPPMVEMPLLLGLQEEEAIAVLDSLGLTLLEVETRFRFGRDQGLVVMQEPSAETLVERGSAVRLVVGRRGG